MTRAIRFDDTCVDPMKPIILQIARRIYEELDPANCPIAFDSNYHFAVLSYERTCGSDGTLTPQSVYLTLREGEPGQRETTPRFVLNVLKDRVRDRKAEVFHDAPETITSYLEDVRRYVQKILDAEAAKTTASHVQDDIVI
ncbi:hypothetical protein EIP86_005136 [Pleurotus ostreatoroseus]|nr:hypothetical protein EIP86_005136 [Pleurotus ostreatoroseus]